jgi:hypothetical protein
MPDPISATLTLITFTTFIKDLLDLGQSIRRSIEKVDVRAVAFSRAL